MNVNETPVLNVDEVEPETSQDGQYWGGSFQAMTPYMENNGGSICLNVSRLPPGRIGCPFHYHCLDDEIFYILSGTGLLRYGEKRYSLRPGDTVSCPAGTKNAHQIANTGEEELVYLAIGANSKNEVCFYPDSGKTMVRSLKKVGVLEETSYMHAEPISPSILEPET